MLTLDGTLPSLGGSGMGGGTGLAAGAGVIGGLLLGGLLGNNGNGGLFGGNNNKGGGIEFESLQHQIESVAAAGQAGHLSSSVAGLATQICDLATAGATENFTTLTSINGLGRDLLASQNQIQLQQLNSFNNLQFQNAQATNQIIAQGNAAAAAAAACCCELRAAISNDGNATRALINDLNVQNLRDQLAAANSKVSNNEQNQYLLSTILTHLHPVVSNSVVS